MASPFHSKFRPSFTKAPKWRSSNRKWRLKLWPPISSIAQRFATVPQAGIHSDPLVFSTCFSMSLDGKKLEKLELDWTPGCLWFLKISVYQIRNICRFWSTDPTDFEDLTSTFVRIHHPAIQWLGSSYQATWRRTHDETQWIGGIFNRKAPILNGKIDSFQSSKRSSKLSL